MAQRVILVDDIDGIEGAETYTFALENVEYEIDLNAKNIANLRKDLEPWIKVARKKRGRSTTPRTAIPSRPSRAGQREQLNAIREWGRKHGFKVSDRGKPPRDVVDAFEAAHNGTKLFSHS